MADVIQIDSNTWRIEDGFVRFFLLEGEESAALIDSGVNCPDASDIAKKLTSKPLILINTHGDMDHISGTNGFTNIHIHQADYVECGVQNRFPNVSNIPLNDRDIIDLGARPIKVMHIPGHTKGSVAFLDVTKRALYVGDSVQKGHIFMFGPNRCPELFGESLDKIIAIQSEYDRIYASHDEYEVTGDYAVKVKEAWMHVQNGDVPYEMIELFGRPVKSYTTPVCGFYME